jgi:hypothetical protein
MPNDGCLNTPVSNWTKLITPKFSLKSLIGKELVNN